MRRWRPCGCSCAAGPISWPTARGRSPAWRDTLLSYFPGLERAFDLTSKGPLLLVSRYNTPDGIRRSGLSRIERYLKGVGALKAHDLAQTAVVAAKAQGVRVAGQDTASAIVSELAAEVLRLTDRLAETDEQVSEAFSRCPGGDHHLDAGVRTPSGG